MIENYDKQIKRTPTKMAENRNEETLEFLKETEQDPEVRRQIRTKYRNFITELQEQKEDLINPDSIELNERLSEADELFKPVKCAREVALDSQAVSLIATFGRMKAQALSTEFLKFQSSEFASKIIKFVGGEAATQTEGVRISPEGWARLGRALRPSFKQTPPFQFMLGSFERGPKPVKVRQQKAPREKDNTVGKETVPQQLKDFNSNDQNEATTQEVEKVHKLIKELYQEVGEGINPLSYFDVVLNPDSFGHTIENIFHVSFLIRDGVVQMEMDEDGLPVIRPIDPEEKPKEGSDGKPSVNQQTAITLTQDEWKELVRVFKIEEACITPSERRINDS